MKSIFLLLVIALASSCTQETQDSQTQPDIEILVSEITNRTFLQLKKERELYPFGIGSGIKDQVRMLALSFCYYKDIEMEQARELLLAATSRYLDNINRSNDLRPFLVNHPFEPKNIEIRIFLRKPDGSNRDNDKNDKLSLIEMIRGNLEYDIRNPQTGHLECYLEESYEEAFKIHGNAVSL